MSWDATSREGAGANPPSSSWSSVRGGLIIEEGILPLVGGTLVLAASFLYPYLKGWMERITPGCLFHRVTGLPCLLCGMTRSLAATSHGRLAEAFRYHLLGPPLFLMILAITLGSFLERALGRRVLPRPGGEARKRIARAGLALLAAAWVARLAIFGVNV